MLSKKNFMLSAICLIVVCLAVAITLIWARHALQQHTASVHQVRNSNGIEALEAVEIGGVEQWLHIRGRHRDNPILLYLHGGPGTAMIGMMDAIQRPWEDFFTVVQWDQRQQGKSYYPMSEIGDTMTVQQMIADTEEVIQYLRQRFQQKKIVILGHSWGSVLGMHMVKRHPDWVAAYIGLGQLVNKIESEREGFDRLLRHAKRKGATDIVERLEAMPLFPAADNDFNIENIIFRLTHLASLTGESLMHNFERQEVADMLNFLQIMSPHYTLRDAYHLLYGDIDAMAYTDYPFFDEILAINLPEELGSSFEVPIFFFTGRHDWQVSRSLSEQWFQRIDAPYKELVWFEESAHVVVNEEPGKFLMALVGKVLPFAQVQK